MLTHDIITCNLFMFSVSLLQSYRGRKSALGSVAGAPPPAGTPPSRSPAPPAPPAPPPPPGSSPLPAPGMKQDHHAAQPMVSYLDDVKNASESLSKVNRLIRLCLF